MPTTYTLPHLPTEIWDKIYDIKESMEERDEHKEEMWQTFRFIETIGNRMQFEFDDEQVKFTDMCKCWRCGESCLRQTWSDRDGVHAGNPIFDHEEYIYVRREKRGIYTHEPLCPDCIDYGWEVMNNLSREGWQLKRMQSWGWSADDGLEKWIEDLKSGGCTFESCTG
tara:strand:- start:101 stop:604 length:504 start_codon:yes stop_codon:yes gene_type:complete